MAYLLWHHLIDGFERFGSRPAVAWRDEVITYAELESITRRMAGLLAEHGIGRECRVAVFMPKSARGVAGLLGTMRSGAAYVPIDPNAPGRRAAFIMNDCRTEALVTTTRKLRELREHMGELRDLKLVIVADDGADAHALQAEAGIATAAWTDVEGFDGGGAAPIEGIESDPAYLLYTSGSTGNPKGVVLSHRHALTFVEWGARTFGVTADDRLSNHAPFHFDLSIFDIYVALRCGACVVLVPDQVAPFPVQLASWIETEGITVWYSVPSALTRLLLHGQLERFEYGRLRTVLFAGEVFPVKYLRGVMERLPHATFFNLYGPTETNVCTYYEVPRPLAPDVEEIPIGRACANTEVFALDAENRPIAPGEAGELCVRGPAVMLGYWGLPEKTSQVLGRNPLQPAYYDGLYRTGDLVRLRTDADYEFIGRKDHMVKSRGYRIELGEIEQVLHQHEGVREAVVIAVPDDEIGNRLSAMVATDDGSALDETALRSYCLGRIPKYMVPERIVFARELPKTSTGKADRVALARLLAPAQE